MNARNCPCRWVNRTFCLPGLAGDCSSFCFLALAGAVIDSVVRPSSAGVEAIWDHAYNVYDRLCRQSDPSFSLEENRELMRRYLVGPRRSAAGKTKKRPR